MCQGCARAVGACPWSRDLVPVPGWDADETIARLFHKNGIDIDTGSYLVKKCPLFRADEQRHTETIRIDRVKPFAFKLIISAIEDYANAFIQRDRSLRDSMAWSSGRVIIECEKYLKCDMVADMLDLLGINMNVDRMLQMVREDPQGTVNRIKTMLSETNQIELVDEYTEEYYEKIKKE